MRQPDHNRPGTDAAATRAVGHVRAAYLKDWENLDSKCVETDVKRLMQTWVLPPASAHEGIECSDGFLLSAHLIPAFPGVPPTMKVSQPKPDLI
jgi:hypothetical protein